MCRRTARSAPARPPRCPPGSCSPSRAPALPAAPWRWPVSRLRSRASRSPGCCSRSRSLRAGWRFAAGRGRSWGVWRPCARCRARSVRCSSTARSGAPVCGNSKRNACPWPRAAPWSSSLSTASRSLSDRPRNGRCSEMTAVLVVLVVFVVLAVSLAGASVRVLREYERGVVFRFGRLVAQKGPGLVLLVPVADRMVRVTLRTITHTIPPQDVITRDNVPARVDAVAYFRVVDADASVVDIEDHLRATSEIAKTTLRSVLGKAELDTLLSEREHLNEDLQRIIDEHTEPWGIKVVAVEIKDVGIPQDMQRAMARQAEAERDRRAMVINAEAEFQAASRLAEAATLLSADPAALQLRYLQTLSEVGKGEGSTVLLPLPLDVIGSVVRGVRQNGTLSSAHG